VSPEEMAGSIKIAFDEWGGVGPPNHVLDEGPDPPEEAAILADFLPTECYKIHDPL